MESLAGALLLRRWSFARASFWSVLRDCWRLRGHISRQRKMVATFRKHSDFWMLRFFKLRLNRWDEVKRTIKFGPPGGPKIGSLTRNGQFGGGDFRQLGFAGFIWPCSQVCTKLRFSLAAYRSPSDLLNGKVYQPQHISLPLFKT